MATQKKVPVYNLFVPQGTDWSLTLIYRDENKNPKNITGYSVSMQARRSYDHPDKIVDLSTPSGGITIDGPNGKITIKLTSAQTGALRVFQGVYDILITDTAGEKSRLLMGSFEVLPAVTR